MRNLAAPERQHNQGLYILRSGLAEALHTAHMLSVSMRVHVVTMHMEGGQPNVQSSGPQPSV